MLAEANARGIKWKSEITPEAILIGRATERYLIRLAEQERDRRKKAREDLSKFRDLLESAS